MGVPAGFPHACKRSTHVVYHDTIEELSKKDLEALAAQTNLAQRIHQAHQFLPRSFYLRLIWRSYLGTPIHN